MINRRKILTVGCASVTALLAGCSSEKEPSDNSEDTVENETEEVGDTGESQTDSLPDFSVIDINFNQTYSSGLICVVELEKESEEPTLTVTINMDVYVDGEIVAEGRNSKDISTNTPTEIEVSTEEVGPSGDINIEEVSSVEILGRQLDTEDGVLESFSGDTVRSNIN